MNSSVYKDDIKLLNGGVGCQVRLLYFVEFYSAFIGWWKSNCAENEGYSVLRYEIQGYVLAKS